MKFEFNEAQLTQEARQSLARLAVKLDLPEDDVCSVVEGHFPNTLTFRSPETGREIDIEWRAVAMEYEVTRDVTPEPQADAGPEPSINNQGQEAEPEPPTETPETIPDLKDYLAVPVPDNVHELWKRATPLGRCILTVIADMSSLEMLGNELSKLQS